MDIKEQIINRYQEWYKNDKQAINKKEKEVKQLIKQFLAKFTETYILNMEIDDYIVGKNSTDSFCYWVETKLKDAGEIHGSYANKFGIYYKKEIKNYKIQTPKHDNSLDKAFLEIKQLIIELIHASKKRNIEEISRSKLSNMFKNKIAYLYNYDAFLPIYGPDDIKKLLIIFELPYNKKNESIEKQRERLYEFYKSLNLVDCSPWRFMKFVYSFSGYRSELRESELIDFVKTIDKEPKIEIETINNLVDLFRERNFEGRKSVYQKDQKKENDNELAGKKGEYRAISYFERNKKNLNIVDIKYYCEKSGRDANDLAGCDIEYVTKDGTHWYVEVKSTKSNKSKRELFYMSDIEFNKMKAHKDNYYILYFNNVYNDNKVYKIPARLLLGKEHPIKYIFDLEETGK